MALCGLMLSQVLRSASGILKSPISRLTHVLRTSIADEFLFADGDIPFEWFDHKEAMQIEEL